MATTVLVIGGTGNIGKEVVRALVAHHRETVSVFVGVRGNKEKPHSTPTREIDLDKPETLEAAFAGISKVLLVSPLSPAMASHAKNVVEAARKAKVSHIVRSSVLGANHKGEELISEAKWHNDADEVIRKSNIPYTILLPNQYFQNFTNFANPITVRTQGAIYLRMYWPIHMFTSSLSNSLVFVALADAKVSNIDTRDLGEIAASILADSSDRHHSKEYELTGGESLTMEEICGKYISAALQKPVK